MLIVTAESNLSNPYHLNFYDGGFNRLYTGAADVGPYVAPSLSAYWSIVPDGTLAPTTSASIICTIASPVVV